MIGTGSVSSDKERRRLGDIVTNVDAIDEYLSGPGSSPSMVNRMMIDAVERCMQRITEAVVQIGADRFAKIAPDVSFSEVKSLGNRLRHDYGNIDQELILNTVRDDLPPLRQACIASLERADP